MRAALALEWIGYNAAPLGNATRGHAIEQGPGHWRAVDVSRPWVARLTGVDSRYGFTRAFLDGQIDFSQANSVGSRGVMLYYALAAGVYEVYARESWKRGRRSFIRVDSDTTITEIDREEVMRCLCSAVREP